MEMLEPPTTIFQVWWDLPLMIHVGMIGSSLFLEGAICLWRKERYSWRRALAIVLVTYNGPYLFRRLAGCVTAGILETMRLWAA